MRDRETEFAKSEKEFVYLFFLSFCRRLGTLLQLDDVTLQYPGAKTPIVSHADLSIDIKCVVCVGVICPEGCDLFVCDIVYVHDWSRVHLCVGNIDPSDSTSKLM